MLGGLAIVSRCFPPFWGAAVLWHSATCSRGRYHGGLARTRPVRTPPFSPLRAPPRRSARPLGMRAAQANVPQWVPGLGHIGASSATAGCAASAACAAGLGLNPAAASYEQGSAQLQQQQRGLGQRCSGALDVSGGACAQLPHACAGWGGGALEHMGACAGYGGGEYACGYGVDASGGYGGDVGSGYGGYNGYGMGGADPMACLGGGAFGGGSGGACGGYEQQQQQQHLGGAGALRGALGCGGAYPASSLMLGGYGQPGGGYGGGGGDVGGYGGQLSLGAGGPPGMGVPSHLHAAALYGASCGGAAHDFGGARFGTAGGGGGGCGGQQQRAQYSAAQGQQGHAQTAYAQQQQQLASQMALLSQVTPPLPPP